jgi:putative membrane protein
VKRFNINEFIWFTILLGFTTFFYYLLTTGKISMFISPKMLKYMIFSFLGFGVLSLYQCTKIFTVPSRKPINKSYMVLIITLIIGFVAAQKGLNLNIADTRSVNMANSNTIKVPSSIIKMPIEEAEEKEKEAFDEGTIEFDDQNYFEILGKIGDDTEKYKGRKVIVSGFVYKDEDFKTDEFVVARLMMSCCAADSQVVGLMSKWPNAETLEKEVWVKIEGTIDSTRYKEKDSDIEMELPIIIVNKVEEIQKPDNIYVYPK